MKSPRIIPRNVVMLGIVSLFTDASSEMIYPLIPIFVATLGSGAIALGVIEGVAETTAAVLKLFSGIISDKVGKRKLLVTVGYSLSSLIRPFTGLVSTAWQIVFIRVFDRVGKGIRTAPRDALIASSVDESMRGKAYGFHRAMDHAGAVLGPLLAISTLVLLVVVMGITDALLALRYTFLLAAVPGLLAVMTVVFFVKERVDGNAVGKPIKFSLKQFDRNFIAYLSIVTLFTLGNSSDVFLLFRVEEAIHRSGAVYSMVAGTPLLAEMVGRFGDVESQKKLVDILFLPLVWAFFHVIKAAFSTPLGSLSDRIGRKLVINIGWGIYALVYLCFAFLDRLPEGWQVLATFALFAIYGLFYAFTEGTEKAFVADLVRSDVRGGAFGMYNFAVGLGALPASIIFGLLYSTFGATTAFGAGAAIAGVSMLLLALFVSGKEQG
ncbi:MAG TPA: MFS transporter [Bacteroidetes bacterium]|jgi:MFS family permease|nr:MFS transporter [Bacteroidota bacterium]